MRNIVIGMAGIGLGLVLRIVPTVLSMSIISVIIYGIFAIGVGAFVGATPLINNKKQVVISYIGIVFGTILFDFIFYIALESIGLEFRSYLSNIVATNSTLMYLIVISIINSIFYLIPCYFGHFATYSEEISDKSDNSDVDEMSRIS